MTPPSILKQFTHDEWEMLCDNCGLCCLYKIEDPESGSSSFTSVVCRYWDREKFRCSCYAQRCKRMSECTKITPAVLPKIAKYLPKNCAYRCVYEGSELPSWHPLFQDVTAEGKALLEKLKDICVQPNACADEATVRRVMLESEAPQGTHAAIRILVQKVIEDTEL